MHVCSTRACPYSCSCSPGPEFREIEPPTASTDALARTWTPNRTLSSTIFSFQSVLDFPVKIAPPARLRKKEFRTKCGRAESVTPNPALLWPLTTLSLKTPRAHPCTTMPPLQPLLMRLFCTTGVLSSETCKLTFRLSAIKFSTSTTADRSRIHTPPPFPPRTALPTTCALLRPAHTIPHFSLCAMVLLVNCPLASSSRTTPAHLLWLRWHPLSVALEVPISRTATSWHCDSEHDSINGWLEPITLMPYPDQLLMEHCRMRRSPVSIRTQPRAESAGVLVDETLSAVAFFDLGAHDECTILIPRISHPLA
mmetsp:Transcript_17182/g.25254  ORF Transcript_17182/g.25254 Transcript_17182/m.25254 type:complete len:310 (+) Transcript_17182:1557-2486(+)